MLTLRPYQSEAVQAVYRHLQERDDNPCVVIPTAGGKSLVMAQMCRDAVGQWSGRVLILAHVRELLEQTVDKLSKVAPEMLLQVGVYSAGLKSRDTEHPVIVAGIQSVYKRACELGAFDLIVVDEAHLIPPDGEGMYRTFLADAKVVNPNVRVIGMTATPFRMTTGHLCGPENILNEVCYEVGVRELIVQGYLCPLISKAARERVDTSNLHLRGGEFIASETEDLMDTDALVEAACREIVSYTRDRKSCLVFATGVSHARHVADKLRSVGHEVAAVFGDTLPFERDEAIGNFKAGKVKYLVNVNVLTTGFDAPNVDCVALLRPTMSPGLYSQMVGRGFRLHPGKGDCLVLDFGGNILRHGPVDAIRIKDRESSGDGEAPAKECPQCHSVIALGYQVCPDCGYEFPEPERQRHDAQASTAGILSGSVTVEEHEVRSVTYGVHVKRDAPPDAPRTMRVDYRIGEFWTKSEWVCFEHTGWARKKAEFWWKQRSNAPVPETVDEAVALAEAGALCETLSIAVRSAAGEKYDSIVGYDLGEIPPWREPGEDDETAAERPWVNLAEVPF